MIRRASRVALAGLVLAMAPALAAELGDAPPGGAFRKFSDVSEGPAFVPGLGALYVDPRTLPKGPFLAYDRAGRPVSTIYMIPLKDFETHMKVDLLAAPGGAVDHVDIYYVAGHPGVEEPHYHIVLWHVTKAKRTRVAQ
jgi:hypothetical protein